MIKQAVRELTAFIGDRTANTEADEQQRAKALDSVEGRIKRATDETSPDLLDALHASARALRYNAIDAPRELPETIAPFFFSYLQCTGRKSAKMHLHKSLVNLTEYIRRDRDEAEAIFWDTLWSMACEIDGELAKGASADALTYKAYRPASKVGNVTTAETWDGVTFPIVVLTGKKKTHAPVNPVDETGERLPMLDCDEAPEGWAPLAETLIQVEITHRGLTEAWQDKTWMNRLQDKLIKRFARAFVKWEQQGTTYQCAETISRMSIEEQAEAGRMDFILSQAGTTLPQVETDATSLITWVSDALPEYLRESLTNALTNDRPMPERDRKRVLKHLTAHDITLQALQDALTA